MCISHFVFPWFDIVVAALMWIFCVCWMSICSLCIKCLFSSLILLMWSCQALDIFRKCLLQCNTESNIYHGWLVMCVTNLTFDLDISFPFSAWYNYFNSQFASSYWSILWVCSILKIVSYRFFFHFSLFIRESLIFILCLSFSSCYTHFCLTHHGLHCVWDSFWWHLFAGDYFAFTISSCEGHIVCLFQVVDLIFMPYFPISNSHFLLVILWSIQDCFIHSICVTFSF